MSNANKIVIGVMCFLILSVVTVVIPFQKAENDELIWTNNKLNELKQSRGVYYLELDDPEVNKILDEGKKYGEAGLESAMKSSASLITLYAAILGVLIYRIRVKAQ